MSIAMLLCGDVFMVTVHGRREESPNDPKLSDGGGGAVLRGGVAAAEAASVTAGAVRCSAWLGVAVDWAKPWKRANLVDFIT